MPLFQTDSVYIILFSLLSIFFQKAAEEIAWLRGLSIGHPAVDEVLAHIKMDQTLAHQSILQLASIKEIRKNS